MANINIIKSIHLIWFGHVLSSTLNYPYILISLSTHLLYGNIYHIISL
jgi:hypothetical protein